MSKHARTLSTPRQPADQNKHATSGLPAQTLETLSQIFLRSYLPRQAARPALFITRENRKYLRYAQTSAQSPHRNNVAHYALTTGGKKVHTQGCNRTKPCRPHKALNLGWIGTEAPRGWWEQGHDGVRALYFVSPLQPDPTLRQKIGYSKTGISLTASLANPLRQLCDDTGN